MEEPVRAQTTPTQLPNPPTTAQCPPPQPPAPTPPRPPKSKKRPLDTSVHIHNPRYFKMRAVLKELRPHFIEVLRTRDFRNCEAAREIREQMKLLMELCKEIRAETVSIVKSKNVTESQPLSGENREGQKPQEQLQDLKPRTEQPQTETIISKSSWSKSLLGVASEKHTGEDGQIPGTYVVGGSAFGWNFITYLDSESVYYGVTKEAFRTSNSAE